MDPLGFTQHNHAHCISDALDTADRRCRANGMQFTPVRRRVLEILLQEHRALGAYDILDRLRAEGLGSQPPVAYRALDFLVGQGLVHRVERLNAFIACTHPKADHAPAFLICRKCDAVAETSAAPDQDAVGRAAELAGFQMERAVIEVEGLCPACKSGPAS